MNARSRYETLLRQAFLPLVLVIFTASGFAGLIYQSIWSHYIKLFLGHAAYAQSLVLAIFMGGMALGAWLASRWSPGWRNLLLAYALAEALIGIASLGFHGVFVEATRLAFDEVVPALGSPGMVHAFKWSLAAALILPQSILLGMTFPLMTGGVLRLQPERSGYVIAMLYFTNSLGAAAGVLASGFYLIEAAGLPGTLAAAASVNLAVAVAAILLPRKREEAAPAAASLPARASGAAPQLRLLLAVSALTGLSSFMYEIGWVRMLSLVLGSSTHAFELMLSAFILGIAFGGLWIRRRIDAAGDAMRLLGIVQIAMGLAALATLPVYAGSFHVMRAAVDALSSSEGAYTAFNLISHGICLAVMFPAAFCAGMTLPLITVCLLRQGGGERAIGQVYGANTLGAIAGVLIAVHVGLPLLGLKSLIIAAAAIDLALGILLLGTAPVRRFAFTVGATAVSLGAVALAAVAVHLDAHRMASGVYRLGSLLNASNTTLLHHEDGKTSTVSVTLQNGVFSLRNNGKSDGSLNGDRAGAPTGDEPTMALLGTLPILIKPESRLVANIGFGTGLTAHALLASERVERLDTIEIEPAVVRASRHLMPHNARAYDDPRSRVHIEDAKTFFSTHRTRYDIIISEPSNPWVSGVAGLFSSEFYVHARRHLREGGLFVQWVQLYEFSPELLASVIQALSPVFSDYVIWLANDGDLIIVAANGGRVPEPQAAAMADPRIAEVLDRFHIRTMDDLLLHRVASRAAMEAYFSSFGVEPNSDFFPTVDLHAAKARFMKSQATAPLRLTEAPLPVLDFLDRGYTPDPARVTRRPGYVGTKRRAFVLQAEVAHDYMLKGDVRLLSELSSEFAGQLALLRAAIVDCRIAPSPDLLPTPMFDLARLANGFLRAEQASAIWARLNASRCKERLDKSTRRWLALHTAVAARQATEMADAAEKLLKEEPELRHNDRSYAVAVLMAGRLLAGENGLANKVFQEYRTKLRPEPQWQPVFTLLSAHALGPVLGTPLASR